MNTEDLIGIRETDLDSSERAALAERLLSDPEARREHDAALRLSSELSALVDPPAVFTTADVLAKAAEQRRKPAGYRAPVAGILALAAATVLWVNVGVDNSPEDQRFRGSGVEGAMGSVHLEAAAEGPSGLRALADGADVSAIESALFQVTTTSAGYLVVFEANPTGLTQVWPDDGGSWQAPAGQHAVGGATPLGWRPDDGAGRRVYEVWLCEAPVDDGADLVDGNCAVDRIVLNWEEAR